MEPVCECGHVAQWHHQFGSQPCGAGDCACRQMAIRKPAEKRTKTAVNLFGEVQEMVERGEPV